MIVSCQRSVAKFPVSGPWPSGALGRRRVADFRAYGRVITRQATRLLRPYRTLEQSSSRTRCEKPAPWNVGCLVADRNNVDHSMRRNRCCTPELRSTSSWFRRNEAVAGVIRTIPTVLRLGNRLIVEQRQRPRDRLRLCRGSRA